MLFQSKFNFQYITVKSKQASHLITDVDRDFLQNHWDKVISSTRDMGVRSSVKKKLDRQERYCKFSAAQSPLPGPSNLEDDDTASPSSNSSGDEFHTAAFTTKRPTVNPTTLKDILKKMGPAAERLNIPNATLTGLLAAVNNNSGGDIGDITLSTSSARLHRAAARKELAVTVREEFSCGVGQINFDGKLMKGLEGYGKVNRLAVVLVQETENKLLCIAKMEQSTGSVEAEKIKEVLVEWGVAEKIIACGFDTTSSNTGVNKGCCVILQTLLNRQILWLACRHHIPELIIGAAFTTRFGDTKSPEVTLFKVLKDCWDTLDLDDIHLPNIPAFYRIDKDELLSFINSKLQDADHLPRCDYKEYLAWSLLN